jgi:hypothetical protein
MKSSSWEEPLPPYPLSENERALVGTGFLHLPPTPPVTLSEIEFLVRQQFPGYPISVEFPPQESNQTLKVVRIGPDENQIILCLREFSHEGKDLLHVELLNQQDGSLIPMNEQVRYLRKGSEERTDADDSLPKEPLENSIEWELGPDRGRVKLEGWSRMIGPGPMNLIQERFQEGEASVAAMLRNWGWGPLWVKKRAGEAVEYRIRVPAPKNFPSLSRLRDLQGLGPETPLERNLRQGYIPAAGSMDLAIRQMLEEIPPPQAMLTNLPGQDEPSALLMRGEFRHRRLEALHRLLSGERDLRSLRVVDNGPGPLIDLAFTLAQLGTFVTVKEPGADERETGEFILSFMGPDPETPEGILIEYLPAERIDEPTPSAIVYWSNPDPRSFKKPPSFSLQDYIGRDVAPGGYLVIQNDHVSGIHEEFRHLALRSPEWELVFREELPDQASTAANYVLPTLQRHSLLLQIYRRTEGNSESSGLQPITAPGSLYETGPEGRFWIPSSSQKVVILGDTPGARSAELVLQGHEVLHIDRDLEYLEEARRRVTNAALDAQEKGISVPLVRAKILKENWNQVKEEADFVEAYYPLDFRDIPLRGLEREVALRMFLDRALNSKIKPGGVAFMVSEHENIIEDLESIISRDPRLELIETRFSEDDPPLIGGFGVLPKTGLMRHSWLVYRKKS